MLVTLSDQCNYKKLLFMYQSNCVQTTNKRLEQHFFYNLKSCINNRRIYCAFSVTLKAVPSKHLSGNTLFTKDTSTVTVHEVQIPSHTLHTCKTEKNANVNYMCKF